MPDKKLTDNEILQTCKNCLHYKVCVTIYKKSFKNASMDLIECVSNRLNDCENFIDKDLINRLQAENERLKSALTDHEYGNCVAVKNGLIYTHTLEDYDELIGDISAEAYKEFAERVKIKTRYLFSAASIKAEVNDLLKEMTGDGNNA